MQAFNTKSEWIVKRRIRRFPPFVLTSFVIFGFVTLDASPAEATCGDYLSHQGTTGIVLGSMPGDNHPMGDQPVHAPCHGPSCRQVPTHLPLSTPAISFEAQDRWGWMANFVMPSVDRATFLPRTSERISLPMIAFRLDRPPKV